LDEALARLPPRYRDAILLRYLAGMSQEETARELRCPVGTMTSWLSRGLESLRGSLAKIGFAGPATSVVVLLDESVRAHAMPAGLVDRTLAVCTGKAAAAPGVEALMKGVETMNRWLKVKAAAAVALGLSVVSGGGIWLAQATTSKVPAPPDMTPMVDRSDVSPSSEPLALAAETPKDAPPPAPTVIRPTGRYDMAWLTLADGCRMFIAFRDRKPVQYWIPLTMPGSPKHGWLLHVDASDLAFKGDVLSGRLDLRKVNLFPAGRQSMFQLHLDLKVAGAAITGAWKLAGHPQATGSGNVTGELIAEAVQSKAQTFAPGKDYPGYRGMNGGNAAAPSGRTLTGEGAKIRALWKSEESLPCAWGSKAGAAMGAVCGGASTPVIWQGKVYHFFYRPSGPLGGGIVEAEVKAKYADCPPEAACELDHHRTASDVVVLCADGATGKTIWRSTWPLKTGNIQTHKWRYYNPTPLVADGVVYVSDYGNSLYAHDALTGELKWTSNPGFSPCIGGSTDVCSGPILAGGQVIIEGLYKGSKAFDAKTGKLTWKGAEEGFIAKWSNGGQDFIVGRRKEAKNTTFFCINAGDGKKLWSTTEPKAQDGTMVVGDRLIGQAEGTTTLPGETNTAIRLAVWNLSKSGIQKAWESRDGFIFSALAASDTVLYAGFRDMNRVSQYQALDLATGKQLGHVDGIWFSTEAHVSVADNLLIHQPEGRHGGHTLWFLTSDPKDFKIVTKDWDPGFSTTTAYAVQPIYHPIADGRMVIKGHTGLYGLDLRAP
jgi:outer membrane protein assembly factor BamB